ncbi:MAG: nucleotide exchange factor GrpE [Actinomycetota bacterium]|jgi:molecular chaperone GrpE|nr:nucleotide exchange factor GrpE [Actinomycetota bacterium]
MTFRSEPAPEDRAAAHHERGPETGLWPERTEDLADPVDDGIAVGVPAGPEAEHGARETEGFSSGDSAATVDHLRAERDEYLGALQRLQADFENYRKRVQRQQEEQEARAAASLVAKVFPVLDTLDLALAHLTGATERDPAEEAGALEQARSQMLDILGKEGLERVDAAGVEFDPEVHDAVAHAAERSDAPGAPDHSTGVPEQAGAPHHSTGAPDDGDTPAREPEPAPVPALAVDEVLRAGYRWRGQVLRPAMVRVRG